MNIKETVAEIRSINNKMRDCKNSVRMVRLSDRLWDMQSRYEMLLRIKEIRHEYSISVGQIQA